MNSIKRWAACGSVFVLVVGLVCTQAPATINSAGSVGALAGGPVITLDLEDLFSVYRFNSNVDTDIDGIADTFDVMLYEQLTPLTADNFRRYADEGYYEMSLIHRSVQQEATAEYDAFKLIQGGGFAWDDTLGGRYIPTFAPVLNEPGISNVSGTLSLAKQGGDPNSGTSQWYVNVSDNSGALDDPTNNGGFTAFGEVLHDGMDVVTAINQMTVYDFRYAFQNGAFGELPLQTDAFDWMDAPNNDEYIRFLSIEQVTGLTTEILSVDDPTLAVMSISDGQLTIAAGDLAGITQMTLQITDDQGRVFETTLSVTIGDALPDMELFSANFGKTQMTWNDGDLNSDGMIDAGDLAMLASGMFGDVGTPVPEPATMTLLGLGAACLIRRRRN